MALINQPYIGEIVAHQLLENYITKVYFTDIKGRENRQNYEWAKSNLSQEKLITGIENHLKESPNLGVPHFFVSFPHVTVGFRWGDPRTSEIETNIHKVGLGKTSDLENITFGELNFTNPLIGCSAEVYIMGQENIFRSQSQTMPEYLSRFVPIGLYNGSQVTNPNMVREFLEKNNKRIIYKE